MSTKLKLPSTAQQARFRADLLEHRQKSVDAEQFTHSALREIYVATDLLLTPEELGRFIDGEPLDGFVPKKRVAEGGTLPGHSCYTLAKTQASLVGAAILCVLWCLTFFLGLRWIQPQDAFIIDPDARAASGAIWTAANYFLETALVLLAIIGGAIGAYRGSLKLNLSRISTGTLVLISFVPPVAIIVHGALLFRLHKEKLNFAVSEPVPVAGAKWPWVGALICFLIAATVQIILADVSRQATVAMAEIADITSPDAVQELIDDANRDSVYYGRDYGVALFSRAQEAGRKRELAEGKLAVGNRSANALILCSNFSVLAALGFVVVWVATNIRSRKAIEGLRF